MTAQFVTALELRVLHEWDGHRPRYMLLAPLRYASALLEREIIVPAGFVFDGESSPTTGPFTGPVCLPAGAVHDWLYSSHEEPKMLADLVYREALLSMGIDPVWAEQRYQAVDFYGKKAYDTGPTRKRLLDPFAAPTQPYGALVPRPPEPTRPTEALESA